MLRLIKVNIDKKLSLLSLIFMAVSILAIYIISILEASFNLTDFQTLNQEYLVIENFINETIGLLEMIGVVFIIMLVELELFHNTDNFDSYFVALKGKSKYLTAKLISYAVIILLFTIFSFLGFMVIYMLRFKTTLLIPFLTKCFVNYMLYFLIIFAVAYLLVLLFKNYFSAILVFIYYWVSKMIETKEEILNILLPKITTNIQKLEVSFQANQIYLICYLCILLWCLSEVYKLKDLKINS